MADQIVLHNHPEYSEHAETYSNISDFEDGSANRVKKHLRAHASEVDGSDEGKKNFQIRQERLYNQNFCSPYLFLHWAHMSQPMAVTGIDASEQLQAIAADATGYGEDYVQTSRNRLWHYMRHGRIGTLVDGPETIAPDKADAKAAGERSYQVLYEATLIRDWRRFDRGARKGKLSRLVLQQNNTREKDGKLYSVFREFVQPPEKDALFTYRDLRSKEPIGAKGYVNDEGGIPCVELLPFTEGGLPYIPFVIMGEGPDESFIKDVWPLNFAHLNLSSVLSHIIYNQGFQRSIFAGIAKEEIAKMCEWAVTVVSNPGAQVFTIPPGDPAACFQELERLERQIHRRAKFEFNQLSDDTRQVQSADSKAKDLIAQKAIYDNTLDTLTAVELKIWSMHADFENFKSKDAIGVSIEREYGIDDQTVEQAEEREIFEMARELGVTELLKEVLKLKVAKQKFIPGAEDATAADVRTRLFEQIDAADPGASNTGTAFGIAGGNLFGTVS